MSDVGAPPVVRIQSVEADEPPQDLDLRSADEWQILLELDGTACAALKLPNPGEGTGPAFIAAALLRHADGHRAHRGFVADFRERLGAQRVRTYRPRSVSVVICTHRRPTYLMGALAGAMRLEPAPLEVIVVDNDPGDHDCRELVEGTGARYVREDRRGLNVARASGALAARGELVAYLDDDCLPSRHWLGQLDELFDDPLVTAVTGPAFAFALTTPSQRRRDAIAGFVHGFGRRTYDWTVLRPVHSGSVGAGANMIFRRDRIAELGELFPPDLDSGTASQSGGDLYALYRTLAAGYRVTYDPATFVFHRHRPDADALRATVRGYGVGAAAYLTKTLIEERELATFTIWRWLPQQYVVALVARAVGRGDADVVRLRWEYMLNSFRGPFAWARARADARAIDPPRLGEISVVPPADPLDVATAHNGNGNGHRQRAATQTVSVVIAGDDEGAIERCRAALDGEGAELVQAEGRTRAAQRNAGARAASGEVVVFVDAEVVPEPGFVARHLERHAADDSPDVVLGYCPSRPSGGLAAKHDALWWEDHFSAKRDAVALTFSDVVASNMSMKRSAFQRVGPFNEEIEAYDDWEWGARALRERVSIVFEVSAVARREPPPVSVLARIARAHAQGRAEVMLLDRHRVSLPAAPERRLLVRLFSAALDQGGALPAATLLDALESLRARRAWLALFRLALGAARQRGWRQAGGSGAPGAAATYMEVDVDSGDRIAPPTLPVPTVELRRDGGLLGRLAPRRAQWHGGLAAEAAGVLARVWWPEHQGRWWTRLPGATEAVLEAAPELGDASGGVIVSDADWAAIDARIRASDVVGAAIPLPGVQPSTAWLEAVVPAFEGSRVAAVVGAGLMPDEPPAPLIIHSRTTLPERYATGLGSPFQYIAVSPAIYEALGGFDLDAAACGPHGPVLEYVERALNAGFVIGYRDIPGLDPAGCYRPARAANEWSRWSAAGGLLAADARRDGGAGGWLRIAARLLDGFWKRLVAGDGRRWWIGTRLALLAGCARALRR